MISEEQIELLVERLINRMEQANTYFLKSIGSSISKIRELKPSEAHKLVQILKYGGKYDEIVKELSKYTKLNIKDIDSIFKEYAKEDQQFYKQFYKYRNIPFVPFEENIVLQQQTQALANIVKNEMYNFTRTNIMGYTIRDLKGIPQFYGLRETYNRVLDEALLNVSQGKETFDSSMSRILKDIGGSGLKTIEYESGRSMRLDSAIRMHLKSRLRELHNENQKIYGKEFGANGYEISVHLNPAIDHEDVQGRQFSFDEYNKLNAGDFAKDYKGNIYTLDHDAKNGYRPISELNCYHYIFVIVLGVNKPEYTDEQLKEIIDKNNEGFEFEGKHYTMYEGTQLQRMLERRIREQKDIQTLAKKSDNEFLAGESQHKIDILAKKYKELSSESGLPTKIKRLKVSTYKRSASATNTYTSEINKLKVGEFNVSKYTNKIKPTTNDVVFTSKQRNKNELKHPKDIIYFDKAKEIMENPDKVYLQINKKNTIWAVKQYDGKDVQVIIKINSTSLYQEKELGYKNSIIHIHRIRNGYVDGKIKKGELEVLFDINHKK